MSPNLIKVTFRLKVAKVDLNLKIIPTSKIWLCGFQPVIWKILLFDFLILRSAFAAIFKINSSHVCKGTFQNEVIRTAHLSWVQNILGVSEMEFYECKQYKKKGKKDIGNEFKSAAH